MQKRRERRRSFSNSSHRNSQSRSVSPNKKHGTRGQSNSCGSDTEESKVKTKDYQAPTSFTMKGFKFANTKFLEQSPINDKSRNATIMGEIQETTQDNLSFKSISSNEGAVKKIKTAQPGQRRRKQKGTLSKSYIAAEELPYARVQSKRSRRELIKYFKQVMATANQSHKPTRSQLGNSTAASNLSNEKPGLKLLESGVETLRDRVNTETDFYNKSSDMDKANRICININTGLDNQLYKPRARKLFRNTGNGAKHRYLKLANRGSIESKNKTIIVDYKKLDRSKISTANSFWPQIPERSSSPLMNLNNLKRDHKVIRSVVVKSRQSVQNSI